MRIQFSKIIENLVKADVDIQVSRLVYAGRKEAEGVSNKLVRRERVCGV